MHSSFRSIPLLGLLLVRILSAQTAPDFRKTAGAEWPLVGGDWGNTRYSTLAKINTSNVKQLKGAWMLRLNSGFGAPYSQQATPVVKDGIMYLPTGQQDVFAIDAKTGNIIWKYQTDADPKTPDNKAKRGIALGEGMVFSSTADIRKPPPSPAPAPTESGDPTEARLAGEARPAGRTPRPGSRRRWPCRR